METRMTTIHVKLKPGLAARVEKVVPFEWTIAHYNPALPPVFSTPAMIGMMEVAAAKAIQPALPPGAISVGTRIEVDHLKAVPAGSTVRASAKLTRIHGRFLEFQVEARSGRHVIGRGKVFRAVVEPRVFHTKARRRKRR
jgi:predicted thioesterase